MPKSEIELEIINIITDYIDNKETAEDIAHDIMKFLGI